MKIFASLALLALTLLDMCAADLQSEFLSWKASPAGQLAYENGFVPSTSGSSAARLVKTEAAAAVPTAEELSRFQIAKEMVAKLQAKQPRAVFSLDTPFALLSAEEFKAYVTKGEKISSQRRELLERTAGHDNRFQNSTSLRARETARALNTQADVVDIDWASRGCVTAAIDQGQCQASWAISAVGALEAAHCINTGALVRLSSQDVISCGTNGQNTCSGGVSSRAFEWLSHINDGGVCTEGSFPYSSSAGSAQGCPKNSDPNFACAKVDVGAHFYDVQHFRDHTQLETTVRQQPVAALATTGVQYFQYIKGGVLMGDEAACPSQQLDSSVLIVGFGTLDGVKYWKIRNSWSTWWGDGGFAYIERGFQGAENGACGIETLGYYPVIAAPSDLRCSAIRERVEVLGATLKSVSTVKPQDCCDRCRRESGCKGFVWRYETETCELKSSVTGEQPNAAGGSLTYSGTIMSKAARIQQGTLLDNVDFAANDLFATRTGSAEDCMDACNVYTTCHAFTWTQYLGGSCYLKSKRTLEAKPVAANADGTPFARSGTSYKCSPLLAETDLAGSDLGSALAASAKDCCGICRATDKCGAFSWNNYNGGTCWLKQSSASAVAGAGVVSAFLR